MPSANARAPRRSSRACVKREKEARERASPTTPSRRCSSASSATISATRLNAILTSAKVLTMRDEVLPDGRKRLDRVVSSGARMQRMIEQILDVTRARMGEGIPIAPKDHQDLCAIAERMVDEARSAHPGRSIELRKSEGCFARVNPDRVEQVLSNLLGNAISHGATNRPIGVELSASAHAAHVAVHNFGRPIEPEVFPVLFNPFKRASRTPEGRRAEGLGLGLYIAERIATAHGGKIHVESSLEAGTRFELVLPCGE